MSLHGLSVLVTRPTGPAERLADTIRQAGGRAICFPLLQIEAIDDPVSLRNLSARIKQLAQYQLAIFISTNAARLALPWLQDLWPVLPAGLSLLAIGPATAAELAPLRTEVNIAPGGVRSEDLLQLAALQDPRNRRVVIFRGEGGREVLAEVLQQRGATVDYVELYRRRAVQYPAGKLQEVIRRESVNAIIVTSIQSFANLCEQLGPPLGSNNSQWGLVPLLVPSARVADAAMSAGFSRVINVNAADDQAMLAGLEGLARHLDADATGQ